MPDESNTLSRRRFLLAGAAAVGAFITPRNSAHGAVPAFLSDVAPDSGRDETASIVRALRETAQRGSVLFLAPGRYIVSNLDMPDGSELAGAPGRTVLVAAGDRPAVSARGTRRAALSGLTVEAAGADTSGDAGLLDFRDVDSLVLDDIEVAGAPGVGVRAERCAGRITRSRITGAGQAGVFCLDGKAMDIAHSVVRDCADNGILIWRSRRGTDGARVRDNDISDIGARSGGTGQNGNGINVFRAGGVAVTGNRISRCAFSAVRCNGADDAIVSQNVCRDLGEVALYVEFGFEGAVVAGNIIDGAAHGISVTNFNEGGRLATVSGNIVRRIFAGGPTGSAGCGISAEADTAITGNVVEDVALAGILLGWGSYMRDVAATGNVLRRCPVGIGFSAVPGAGGAAISGNSITGAGRGAVVGFDHLRTVTGDLTVAGAEAFPLVGISGNRVSALP